MRNQTPISTQKLRALVRAEWEIGSLPERKYVPWHGNPSQKDDYMMRNQSNIFAEITVTESCTIPNSRRTITLNDTVTNAVTVRANITAGNVLEGERLYAYAKSTGRPRRKRVQAVIQRM